MRARDSARTGSYYVFPAAALTVETPPPSYISATHTPLQAAQLPTYTASTSNNQVNVAVQIDPPLFVTSKSIIASGAESIEQDSLL